MAGKETHRKKTLLRKEESVADAVIRRYKRSGVLQLSDDVPFPEFIQALHRKDAEFDPGTAKNRAVGRLKYDVMANMLGVLPKNQKPTDDLEDPAWITEWVEQRTGLLVPALAGALPEDHTAQRFFLSELSVFSSYPWEIPFSSVNLLVRNAPGGNVNNTENGLHEHGSERIIEGAAKHHGKIQALWEAYFPNREAGIHIDAYFRRFPPLS